MGCCSNCGNDPCNCSKATCCPDDACTDPGLVDVGRHLPVLDYKFCDRRLENVEGFLVCQINGSGTAEIFFTNEPCIVPKTLEINTGDSFGGVAAFLGDAGCLRTVKPADGVDTWLKADGNGGFVLAPLPPDNDLPDPIQVNELIVNDTATIKDLVIGETLCFDELPSDTVTQTVGLNADNCLVKGDTSSFGVNASYYYETASLTVSYNDDDEGPNAAKTDGENAVIGNEIYDPDALSHVLNETTVRIDEPGAYLVMWHGMFGTRAGDAYAVTLNLKVNGTVVANGNARAIIAGQSGGNDLRRLGYLTGFHIQDFVANDDVQLRVGVQTAVTSHLQYAKLILVRLKPS